MHRKTLDTVYKKQTEGVGSFLKKLKISHWLILAYPIFMFMIRRQRDFDDIYVIDTAALVQIVLNIIFGIYAAIRFLQALPALKKGLFNKPLIWLLLYCVLAIISVLWSDNPEYTLYRSFEILIFLILIADAMITLNTIEDMIKFQLLFGFVLVLFWHLTKIRNGFSLEIMHDSLIPGTIVTSAFIGWMINGWRWRAIHFIILLSILSATSSATYISLIVGVGTLLIFQKGKVRLFGIVLIFLIIFLIVAYGFDFIDIIFWGKSEQNILTASGRIPVWEWVLREKVSQRPILGYSFGQGEAVARVYDFEYGGFHMLHMHNVVLGALTNLGTLGFILLTFLFLNNIKCIFGFREKLWRPFMLAATCATTLNALSISSISSPLSFGWIGQAMFISAIAILNINKEVKYPISNQTTKYRIVW